MEEWEGATYTTCILKPYWGQYGNMSKEILFRDRDEQSVYNIRKKSLVGGRKKFLFVVGKPVSQE